MATAAHPLLPPRVSKRDYAQSASRHSLPRRLAAPGPATVARRKNSFNRFQYEVRPSLFESETTPKDVVLFYRALSEFPNAA